MKTKLENSLEALVVMLALNVKETDGRFTDGEILAINAVLEVCETCISIVEFRNVLDNYIKKLES